MARGSRLVRLLPVIALAALLLAGLAPAAGAAALAPSARPVAPTVSAPGHAAGAAAIAPSSALSGVTRTAALPGRAPMFPPSRAAAERPAGADSVTPTITTTPAAMGVSDLGIGPTGAAYAYETTSFRGDAEVDSLSTFTAANATDPAEAAPNWLSLQLNTVAVNVSVPGHGPAGTFWIQNGLRFNGTTLQFEDNVWNFSNPVLSMPYSTMFGKIGSIHPTLEGGNYYAGLGPSFHVTLPFSVQLYTNISSTTGSRTVAEVSYYLSYGSTHAKLEYDTLTFNGSAPAAPSEFAVNGFGVNPAGSEYDSELVFGGNGAGANANVLTANGTLALDRWSGTAYVPIPSAYDFGPDSSESVYGLAEWYTGTTVHFGQGPSFLAGFWNTTSKSFAAHAAPGWVRVRLSVEPTYAVVFATNKTLASGPIGEADYSYAPTAQSGALSTLLPPPPGGEPYVFGAWADGYHNATVTAGGNSTTPTDLDLVASSTVLNAPVYLLGDAQAAAFASSGTAGLRYLAGPGKLWFNDTGLSPAAPFLRLNDANVPTFELFATDDVNLTIALDDVFQTSTTFTYTQPSGGAVTIAGWTQGYFFYGGRGTFLVQNTTITGSATSNYELLEPPSTIQFYDTTGSAAHEIDVADDAVGVTAVDARSVSVFNVTTSAGGVGVVSALSSDVSLNQLTATGSGPTGYPSWVAQLLATTTVTAHDFTATASCYGLYAVDVTGLTLTDFGAFNGATALNLTATNDSSVSDLRVQGNPEASAGTWSGSNHATLEGVTVDDAYGLGLLDDTTLTVEDGVAIGFDSAVVAALNGSTEVTIEHLNADDGAGGAVVSAASFVTLSGLYAGNGSLGVLVVYSNNVTATDVTSYNLSIAMRANESTYVTLTTVHCANASAAAVAENSSYLTFTGITATNRTLSPLLTFANTSSTVVYPTAALVLVHDHRIGVTGLSVTRYPYAVWSAWCRHVALTSVTDWNSYYAIWANATNASQFRQVFAFGDGLAVELANSSETNVTLSTLEYSAVWGLQLVDDASDLVESNNFIGNNGSSVTGTYRSTNVQANLTGGEPATLTFSGNYWSDHTGSGAYLINTTVPVRDRAPSTSFYSTYLEFTERGLPALRIWTVVLDGANYTMNGSILYIPGWSLNTGALPYTVPAQDGYLPNPASGIVEWTGASETVGITFGSVPGPAVTVPLWVYGAIGAGVVVAVAAVLLVRRRRPKAPATPYTYQAGTTRTPGRTDEWSPDEPR